MAIADNMPNDRPQDLPRRISDLERAVRELRAAHNLDQGTITPKPGMGIRDGNFDGTDFAHPGTQGNYFGGDGLVINNAFFRPGSVSNAALTNPVDGAVRNVSATGFALTTTFVELAGSDITVPAGFTTLLADAGASVFSYNPNTTGGSNGTGGDAIYAMVQLGSQQGRARPTPLSGSGGYQTAFSNAGFQFTGLTPGSILRLSAYGASAYQGLAANVNNDVNVEALLVWLR